MRWNGLQITPLIIFSPIVFSIHVVEDELSTFEDFLYTSDNSILCSDRIFIAVYLSSSNSFFSVNYPINILRNIGIRNVETSHYLMLDADMMLSEKSYEELMALPESLYREDHTAIIVPAIFSRTLNVTGNTLESQLQSSLQNAPKTLEELRLCLLSRRCWNRKMNLFTHVCNDLYF